MEPASWYSTSASGRTAPRTAWATKEGLVFHHPRPGRDGGKQKEGKGKRESKKNGGKGRIEVNTFTVIICVLGFLFLYKHHDQETSWGGRGLFSLHFHIAVHHKRKSGLELKWTGSRS